MLCVGLCCAWVCVVRGSVLCVGLLTPHSPSTAGLQSPLHLKTALLNLETVPVECSGSVGDRPQQCLLCVGLCCAQVSPGIQSYCTKTQ